MNLSQKQKLQGGALVVALAFLGWMLMDPTSGDDPGAVQSEPLQASANQAPIPAASRSAELEGANHEESWPQWNEPASLDAATSVTATGESAAVAAAHMEGAQAAGGDESYLALLERLRNQRIKEQIAKSRAEEVKAQAEIRGLSAGADAHTMSAPPSIVEASAQPNDALDGYDAMFVGANPKGKWSAVLKEGDRLLKVETGQVINGVRVKSINAAGVTLIKGGRTRFVAVEPKSVLGRTDSREAAQPMSTTQPNMLPPMPLPPASTPIPIDIER